MAVEVVMPRLGWTMETGTLAEWLKHDGDTVQEGDVLFTVETDKVAQEVESMDNGILRIPPDSAAIGTAIAVGTVMAYLVKPGEIPPFDLGTAAPPVHLDSNHVVAEPDAPVEAALPSKQGGLVGGDRPSISPRARRVAHELGVDWMLLSGSGRTGRIVERDVHAAAARQMQERTRVTPVARRTAQQAGVDVDEVAAQLPGKRITRADIEAAISTPADMAAALHQATGITEPGAVRPGQGQARPMSKVRQVIASRMLQSAQSVAAVTLTTEADVSELVALRTRTQEALAGTDRPVPSYTDFLAKLTALALLEHPWLNSTLAGDTIIEHAAVHIGIAVDTPNGLLVPVIREAHRKSVQQIAAESSKLIEQSRAGRASMDDLRGSTFTITNLGMYETDAFTPIINLPECAILGVGRIVAKQIVTDELAETVAIRKMMALSLTFDHRIVDGGPAARFLQQIKHWLEQPYAWLTA